MLSHLILAICQLVIACIMIGSLIVFMYAVRAAVLSLMERVEATSRRRKRIKNDIRQSRQHERLRDGYHSS